MRARAPLRRTYAPTYMQWAGAAFCRRNVAARSEPRIRSRMARMGALVRPCVVPISNQPFSALTQLGATRGIVICKNSHFNNPQMFASAEPIIVMSSQ